MLRKTLVALAAAAALGASSAAIAASHHGSAGVSHGSVGISHGSVGVTGGRGPVGFSNPSFSRTITTNRTISTLHPQRNFAFHNRRFHNRNAFFFGGVGLGVGFAGPYYDSCWRLVPTYWGGWRRVWVCDYDYPYWGY